MTQTTNNANNERLRQSLAAGTRDFELRVGGAALRFVLVRAGEFKMGAPENERDAKPFEVPQIPVRITKPFYLARYPVTCEQYAAVMGPAALRELVIDDADLRPVAGLTYVAARAFCDAVAKQSGVTVTLPTEAQWEYACRAGTDTRYYTGDDEADLDRCAWYAANADDVTHPVGQKQPNAWGLYDMLGNVWEYCLDFHENFRARAAADPVGKVVDFRGALRGGGCLFPADECRCASRLLSDDMFGNVGLRLAING